MRRVCSGASAAGARVELDAISGVGVRKIAVLRPTVPKAWSACVLADGMSEVKRSGQKSVR